MVPTPCASMMVAFVDPLSVTVKVSFGSDRVSPFTSTVIVLVVSVPVNVSAPVWDW